MNAAELCVHFYLMPMKKSLFALLFIGLALVMGSANAQDMKSPVRLRFVETSDVHGNYLPFDDIAHRPARGGLSRVATYVRQQRVARGEEAVVLLDNGDILQGQPASYYYNFIDTVSAHLCASVLNYMHYDAATVGNHDIETGHGVYDRWTQACRHPVLCANVLSTLTGRPYWKPYVMLERSGVRIAVLGMLTPTVPKWLPKQLWAGLSFHDMVSTAHIYVPHLREVEKADVVVGLFHSGIGRADQEGEMNEHAALQVAREVPGFDLIFCGHDHRPSRTEVENVAGKKVLVLNPGAGGDRVAVADVVVTLKGKRRNVSVEGELVSMEGVEPDASFVTAFAKEHEAVEAFTREPVGQLAAPLAERDAYFGPSDFITLVHDVQLETTGADLSFAAPLSFDACLEAGQLTMGHMFSLYRYENSLYTILLTGQEIKDYLEASYGGWVRTMTTAADTMLLFRPNPAAYTDGWQRLVTSSYNFDSAAGLDYVVNLRAPKGQRVQIERLSDGRAFSPDSIYTVAVNSYRGNGGGDLLTRGAGIDKAELSQRIVWVSDRDVRHYVAEFIRKRGTLVPRTSRNWRFEPQDWVKQARSRDEEILFGGEKHAQQ